MTSLVSLFRQVCRCMSVYVQSDKLYTCVIYILLVLQLVEEPLQCQGNTLDWVV